MLLGDRPQWRQVDNSGVGKENIDVPVSRFDFGIETIQIFGTRYVSLNCRDVLSDLLSCFIEFLFAASGDHDMSALFDEAFRRRQAYAAVCTSNNCDLPVLQHADQSLLVDDRPARRID